MVVTYKDQLKLWLLIAFSYLVVYHSPNFVSSVVFLVFAYQCYKAKNLYFWLAFFFFIFDGPGRLFSPIASDMSKGVPSYGFSGMALMFYEVIILSLFIRASMVKKPWTFIFKKDFLFLLGFLFFTFFITLTIGISSSNIIQMIRISIPLLLIYIFSKLLDYNDIVKLDSLVFPLVFIAFASQIYTLSSGEYFVDMYRLGETLDSSILSAKDADIARVYNCVYLILYAFHKALYYFFSNSKLFSKKYLLMIIVISFLSLFLSATRGWILAFIVVFILTGLFFSNSKRINNLFLLLAGMLIIFLVLTKVSSTINLQFNKAIERFATVSDVLSGDFSAGGTSQRLDVRGTKVLDKALERPIFGWGFSNTYFQYWDNHVGHHSIFLNVGLFGYLIFLFIFLIWLFTTFKASRSRYLNPEISRPLLIYSFSLVFVFVIHSTSRQLWGFTLGDKIPSFFAIFLLLVSFDKTLKYLVLYHFEWVT